MTPFRPIISDEDRSLDAVSEEVVIRRGRKRQHVEASESEEERT